MIYIIYILVFSNLFCNQIKSSIEISNISSDFLIKSELSYIVGHNSQLYSGFEWWISKNYYIQGFIAPNIKNLKSSVYHQISLGSILFSNSNYESIVKIGLNRQRFNLNVYSNWHQFSISNKYNYKPIVIDFIMTQFSFNKIKNLLYSLSFTYLTSNKNQLSYLISIDEFHNSYSTLMFKFKI